MTVDSHLKHPGGLAIGPSQGAGFGMRLGYQFEQWWEPVRVGLSGGHFVTHGFLFALTGNY